MRPYPDAIVIRQLQAMNRSLYLILDDARGSQAGRLGHRRRRQANLFRNHQVGSRVPAFIVRLEQSRFVPARHRQHQIELS